MLVAVAPAIKKLGRIVCASDQRRYILRSGSAGRVEIVTAAHGAIHLPALRLYRQGLRTLDGSINRIG